MSCGVLCEAHRSSGMQVTAMMKNGGSIALCSSSIAHRGTANHDVRLLS